MNQKTVTVVGEREGDVQGIAYDLGLLHAVAKDVRVILGLGDRDGLVLMKAQQVVGTALLIRGRAAVQSR